MTQLSSRIYTYTYVPLRRLKRNWKTRKFRLSSRPQRGIRSPPVSGPRPRFLVRTLRGSRSPVSGGPNTARVILDSRDPTGHSDLELRSFRRIFAETARHRRYTLFAPVDFVLAAVCVLRSRLCRPASVSSIIRPHRFLSTKPLLAGRL